MFLFPFADYWLFYLGFAAFVLLVLVLDLGVFHRKAHAISVKEASAWTTVWISLALVFNVLFYFFAKWKFSEDSRLLSNGSFEPAQAARQSALEFLTGFVVEKSLAIDNIFIFAMLFSYFQIPKRYQHKILFYGILGALLFRGIFIALGSYLMEYQWVVILFGIFLVFTGVKMLFTTSEEVTFEANFFVKFVKRLLPVDPDMEKGKFFTRKNGVLHVTPLLLALIVIEASDIVFAVDSVPAIFAITKEPLIVFTSNIFAILGLRSMYFLLAGAIGKFSYIKYGLAGVLVFVGLKMSYLNHLFGGKFPITWSLGIIVALIGGSVAYSLWVDRKKQRAIDSMRAQPSREKFPNHKDRNSGLKNA